MREDQIERLKALSEKLADVVLDEADPDNWPGAGAPIAEISQQARGDRFWCKRNAAATFALLVRSESLLTDAKTLDPAGNPVPRPDLEDEVKRAERMAAKALDKARKRSDSLVKRIKASD